jgi:hypothetical protein
MAADRPRYGPLIATVGAALLAVSVFLPWYSFRLTAQGALTAQQALNNVAAEFGNSTFQDQARTVGSGFGALAGQQVASVSGHDAFKHFYVVLLILAAIAFFVALTRLAGSQSTQARGGALALVGLVATAYVLFRMVDRPTPQENLFSVSLGIGIWLALAGSLAVLAGDVWPQSSGRPPATTELEDSWKELSGWTPEG